MSDAERIAKNIHPQAYSYGGGWKTKCISHQDGDVKEKFSLSLKDGDKGLIWHCFGGCTSEAIQAELLRLGHIEKYVPGPRRELRRHIYQSANGAYLFEKVKFSDSSFVCGLRSNDDSFRGGIKHIEHKPLYKLPELRAATKMGFEIIVTEGEKDADYCIARQLSATTTHASGSLTEAQCEEFRGASAVYVFRDNDRPGRDFSKKRCDLIKKIVANTRIVKLPETLNNRKVKDIADFFDAGGSKEELLALCHSAVLEGQSKSTKASRDEYFDLFERVLKSPRRCIFNEKLMYWDDDCKLWNPALNDLDIIKSEALRENETRAAKFIMSNIEPHFFAYERTKPREFLVDIPEWDGTTRVSEMAYLIKLNESEGVTTEAFSDLLKEWCGKVFQRLEDPSIQNRILVLQGIQGAGKDTWTKMLVGGLGQFCLPLSLVKEDKDTYLNLHRGLILKISEFDKAIRAESSTIKDLITAEDTHLRSAYARDAKTRVSRCSFIASANPKNLLRDPTGNRRYLIFEIENIKYGYHGWSKEKIAEWQMQCLAEMKYLAKCKYTASDEHWAMMNDYIQRKTPMDYETDLLEQFEAAFRRNKVIQREQIEIPYGDKSVIDTIADISKTCGVKYGTVRNAVQNAFGVWHRAHRGSGGRQRILRIPEREERVE